MVDHYVVAGATWLRDGLKYRRHRLAEYLVKHPLTSRVYYIAPVEIGFRNIVKSFKEYRKKTVLVQDGIRQIVIPDRNGYIRYGGILEAIVKRKVRNKRSKVNKNVLWYTNPSFPGLSEYLKWDNVVYDCSDLWNRENTEKLKYRSEQRIISQSNIIFATSDYLRDRVYEIGKKTAFVVENGVDYDHFRKAQSNQLDDIPEPRLGFIGGLKFKIDFELLRYLSEKLPHVNIVLIGPPDTDRSNESIKELSKRSNVHIIGGIPYENVPGYMKALDVGLLPYKKDLAYNNAVSPLKLFEYLAAGIPAVGTGLHTTEKYSQQGIYYYTNDTYEDFVRQCKIALEERKHAAYIKERLEIASKHNWTGKFNYMLDIVFEQVRNSTCNNIN